MPRLVAAALLAALSLPAAAADPAGRWKLRFAEGPESVTLLVAFSESGGKWVGDFIGSSTPLRGEPTFSAVAVDGDALRFRLAFAGREFINFDGVVAADGKKIAGSYTQFGGPLRLTELHPSKLKKLDDPFELARENVAQLDGADLFDAGFAVVRAAAAKKVPAEEVRGVADRMGKAAAAYGTRWERAVAVRLANALADQKGFADVAVAQARRAERLLGDDPPATAAIEVTETLARALEAAGKDDDAKAARAAVAKLDARDYAEDQKALPFPVEEYKGRKAKSDRAALLELFTASDVAPGAAAELALAGLLRTYKPTELVALEYHVHIQSPDPLTSPDAIDRIRYYGEKITGAPAVFVNGKPGPEGGGSAAAAKGRYAEYRDLIDPSLEKPARAKLTLAVAKGEKGYTGTAAVADLDAPGDKLFLRFALCETKVRYAGANGVRYHHHVVRAMPGGAKGFPLTKKSAEQAVTFDPADVRAKLAASLDEFARTEGPFPRAERPLALTGLKLVAFVQDDATGEVLQAAAADVGK